jgi:hypothetical protein
MLKHRDITLGGKDEGRVIRLTELPAMTADRLARKLLKRLGEDEDGGLSALAFRHLKRALALDDGQGCVPFVEGFARDEHGLGRSLNIARDLRDWRNVERLQQAAVSLHIDFLIGRDALEVPVRFQADGILSGANEYRTTFCSPQIAAVLESRLATYRELESVLSLEDVFNLVEILNVTAVRDWHAQQKAQNS